MLLPLPLSPTSAVTVPGFSVNVTSSTACTRSRANRPPPTAKCLRQALDLELGAPGARRAHGPPRRGGRRRSARARSRGARGRSVGLPRVERVVARVAVRAARMEAAAGRRLREVGRRAGNPGEPLRAVRSAAGTTPAGRRVYGCRGASCSTDDARRLDDLARVHDRDPVGDLEQQREVVRDEENREAALASGGPGSAGGSRAGHDVERRRRLVHDHELRLERERHRDDHALAHAARELVRIRVDAAAVDADDLEQVAGARRARRASRSARAPASCRRTASPTRSTGLSAFIALWNTIETLRQRNFRSSSWLEPREVLAAEEDAAADDVPGRAEDLRIAFATVLLPQPDSPARPTISPARMSRSTPSTARTGRSMP